MRAILASIALGWLCLSATGQEKVVITWSEQAAGTPLFSIGQMLEADPLPFRRLEQWLGWQEMYALTCESDHPQVKAQVGRFDGGVVVVLWNRSERKVVATLQASLPPGIYTTERLTFDASGQVLTVERRNGLNLLQGGRFQQPHWLAPQSGLVVRLQERIRPAESSLRLLRRSVWQNRASRVALARLAALMREADSHWYQARANLRRANTTLSLRSIHRMLFLISTMHAVASKYAESAETTSHAEQAVDALSELSSALLNSVASIAFEEGQLRIQVANGGAQIWRALRLVAGAYPEAIVLANLRPQERTEFSLGLVQLGNSSTVQISILFNGGYARLRIALPTKEETP